MLQLDCPASPNETGAFRLTWEGPEGAHYFLTENGNLVYEGQDRATAVSGRPEASYRYELRAEGIDDRAFCDVQVTPPSLQLAAVFFGVGVLVFLSTLIFILLGHFGRIR